MRTVRLAIGTVGLLAVLSLPVETHAATIGIYGSATAQADTLVESQGHTGIVLTGLTAGDLAGIDVLWILNGSNSGYDGQITGNTAAIDAFVASGGVLSFHDRYVTGAALVLPGADTTTFIRDLGGTNPGSRGIDLEPTAPALIVNGPGGSITNATLDNGNHSNHGFALEGTLPLGAVPVFNTGIDGRIVDFYYSFGLGWVYYSTIPLDFYLGGATAFATIYAPNEFAFQASLLQNAPEPATLLLFGTGALGLGLRVKRRRRE